MTYLFKWKQRQERSLEEMKLISKIVGQQTIKTTVILHCSHIKLAQNRNNPLNKYVDSYKNMRLCHDGF